MHLQKPARGCSGDRAQEDGVDDSKFSMDEVQEALKKHRRLDELQNDIRDTLAFLRKMFENVLQQSEAETRVRTIRIPVVPVAYALSSVIVITMSSDSPRQLVVTVESDGNRPHILLDQLGYHPLGLATLCAVWQTLPQMFDAVVYDDDRVLLSTLDFLDTVP